MSRPTRRPTTLRQRLKPLISLPWYVNLLLAEAMFVLLKWVLPSLCAPDLCPKPDGISWSEMAWLFSALFLLLVAVIFAARKIQASPDRFKVFHGFKSHSH